MTEKKKDDVYVYNEKRWQAMVDADATFTRPNLDLTVESAREFVDSQGLLGDVSGKRVLCLAGGGGQQSAAFGLLGAEVTVFDLSTGQLKRDQETASHYGITVKTVQGDMRDLSALPKDYYDVVWHPYSINFVPDCQEVFRQVREVIRGNGVYHVMCANPFVHGIGENDWAESGYLMKERYMQGAQITQEYQDFVFADSQSGAGVPASQEYRHTLSHVLNGLVNHGFSLLKLNEVVNDDPDFPGEPGTWWHLMSIAPPWLEVWTRFTPVEKS